MIIYLTSLINPFDFREDATFFISVDGNSTQIASLNEYIETPQCIIVSFDSPLLVDYLRVQAQPCPTNIVDLTHIQKLLTGLPKKKFSKTRPWSIWHLVEQIYPDKDELLLIQKIYKTGSKTHDREKRTTLLCKFTDHLKVIYEKQLEELRIKGEYDRYFQVEKPANQILLRSQYRGLCVNSVILENRLKSLDHSLYSSQKKLRYDCNILSCNTQNEVCEALRTNGLYTLAEHVHSSSYEKFLDIGSEHHQLLKLIREVRRSQRDKRTLLRFGAVGENRIYPHFDPIGTVTGRILVDSPLIQQLKKSSRDIIQADEGFEFLYADFSQFEPGILADDCNDENFISRYNTGDIYTALSIELFGDEQNRKTAKIVFLAFIYGMESKNLAKLINEVTLNKYLDIEKKLNQFFNQFNGLQPYKESLEQILVENGRIGTRLGNYRYRTDNQLMTLLYDERRWVMSQRIQGTASLILKRAILAIHSTDEEIEFLVPMHDAGLFQVPQDKYSEKKQIISDIFKGEFRSECPKVNPNVTFDDFFSEGEEF